MNRDMQPPQYQPIGFWTARVGEAIGARTRGRLAEISVQQPEWWVLHQLSLHPGGAVEAAILDTIGPNADSAAIEEAIADTIGSGWVTRTNGRIALTDAGADRFAAAAQIQRELDAERRQGISEDEYITAITVMQRVGRNVGADLWHW